MGPTPLNDPATYKAMADAAYAKRSAQGVTHPGVVLAARMADAEGDNPNPAAPAATNGPGGMSQAQFSGYATAKPMDKAAMKQALLVKLQAMHDHDAKDMEQQAQVSGD